MKIKRLFWNWIGGFVGLASDLIIIFTFGTITPFWEYRYMKWLLDNDK